MNRTHLLRGIALAAITLATSTVWAQTPTHIYELNGSLADSLGGPALVNTGATLGATGLTFGAGQGPNLSGAVNSTTYSIEMYFSITDVTGYRKLIDFKDRTVDQGLYNLSTALDFYNVSNGPNGVFAPNTMEHLIVTRDGTTNTFTGYVNGVQQLTFADTSFLSTLTGTNNIVHFLRDDTAQNSEQSAGFLDFIRIYDTPLTQAQVTARYNAVVTVPEASPLLLLGAALPFVGMIVRRRIAKA